MVTDLADAADPLPTTGPDGGAGERAAEAAQRLLTVRLGAAVRLADPEDLGGSGSSVVVRVRVARHPFSLPRTLVVKHCATRTAQDPFAREAASCQLFTALRPEERPGPELFASDPAERLLVLEDLGRSGTVASLLAAGPAARAEQALLDWAHALGRLHTSTRGREADFSALLRRLGARSAADPLAEPGRAVVRGLPALLRARLGVEAPPEVLAEVERVAALLGGAPYRAFSPADLGPDNAVVSGRRVRFIDFEHACFRTALLDAAQLRDPFPSGDGTAVLPPGMGEAMVSAWHAEVVGLWPELADRGVLAQRLLDGQLLWTWLSSWSLLGGDPLGPALPAGGPARDRGRVLVSRWESLAAEAEAAPRTGLAGWARAVAAAARRRWAVRGDALPSHPVFR